MKLIFHGIEVECDVNELQSAIDALREIASIAPQPAPQPASIRPTIQTNGPDALRELLRSKGKGFKYTIALKGAGLTLQKALENRCLETGCTAEEIASAIASAPLSDVLEASDLPAIGEDDGEELV